MAIVTEENERDFLRLRRSLGVMSTLLVAASFVLLFVPGPNYGIDFAGGTNIITRFDNAVSEEALRSEVRALGLADAEVQRFGQDGDFQYLIRTGEITSINDEKQAELLDAMQAAFGEDVVLEYDASSGDRVYVELPLSAYGVTDPNTDTADLDLDSFASQTPALAVRISETLSVAEVDGVAEGFGNPTGRRFLVRIQALQGAIAAGLASAFDDFHSIERVETVGPRVGEQLRNDSIRAVLIALAAILLYIAFRFDLRYAPGAVVALFHDILITLGLFVILRQEISLPIVAALLTIVGYSLNDTIVNFDRIRENLELAGPKANLEKLVNRSLNECLSRTVLTSVTTLLVLISIFVLGGGLIRSFALAMMIGVVVGTYSSIFVASPIMIWTSRELDRRQRTVKLSRASDVPSV